MSTSEYKGSDAVSTELVRDDLVVIALEGDVDLTTAPAVAARMREGLRLRRHVVVDLTDATFIDSSAIHMLFQARAAAERMGVVAVLQLGGAASAVERAITIVGLRDVFPCADDREAAIATVRALAPTALC